MNTNVIFECWCMNKGSDTLKRLIKDNSKIDYQCELDENDNVVSLHISKWNVSKYDTLECCFLGCNELRYLDIHGWIIKSGTNLSHMFDSCNKLVTIRCRERTFDKIYNYLPENRLWVWWSDHTASKLKQEEIE